MSLSDVLSATKDLIYSHIELPPDMEDRLALYRNRYPALTTEEVEDLAKMEPARIRIYTGTVYAGERNTLRMHFPMTFNLIRRAAGGQFDSMAMTHAMHEEFPWTGYATQDLAEKFVCFVEKELSPRGPGDRAARVPEPGSIIARIIPEGASWTPEPFLLGSVKLELDELIIARAIDSSGSYLDPASLATLTVGQLLELELLIPHSTRVLRTPGDLLGLCREFINDEEGFEIPEFDGIERSLLGGRNRDNRIRWNTIPAAIADLISETIGDRKSGEPSVEPIITVQTLGECYVAAAIAEADNAGEERPDEQELFGSFVSLLAELLERGLLLKA